MDWRRGGERGSAWTTRTNDGATRDSTTTRAIATRAMITPAAARIAASVSKYVAALTFRSSVTETIGNSSATRIPNAARDRASRRGASTSAASAIATHARLRIASVIAGGALYAPRHVSDEGRHKRFQSPQTVSMRIAQT